MKMSDIEINIKRQIVSYLNKLDDASVRVHYKNLTVPELHAELTKEVKEHNAKIYEKEQAIMKEFKDVYVKVHTDNGGGIFGAELDVYHVIAITSGSYDTDYIRYYNVEGSRIHFSSLGASERVLEGKGNVSDLMREEELRNMTVITKEEYKEYQEKCIEFNKTLDEIINNETI